MKKIITILVAIGLMTTFVACDNKESGESGDNSGNSISGTELNTEGTVLAIHGAFPASYVWSVTNYDSNIILVEMIGTETVLPQGSGELEETTVTSFKITGVKEGTTTAVFDYYLPEEGPEFSVETKEYMITVDELLNVTVTEKEPEIENPFGDEYTASEEMQSLVDALVTESGVQFAMPMTSKIQQANAPTFIGLSEEVFASEVVDSAVYEPMISPATSSLCIVKVSDSSDVSALKKTIIDNCNPAKWVCTGAESCLAIDSGRYILLIMSSVEDCEAMETAFTAHFGAENVGEALTKDGATDFEESAL